MNNDKQEMMYIADSINETFSNYNLPVIVSGGTRTNTTDSFRLEFIPGTKFSKIKSVEDELALSLGVAKLRIQKDRDGVFVEVGREVTTETRLDEVISRIKKLENFVGLIGIDTNGRPLGIRITSSEAPHILIAGTTGSGKTALMRSFLVSLAYFNNPNELRFILLDMKGSGLRPFEVLPHTDGKVISDPTKIVEKLNWLIEEMDRRDREEVNSPQIVCFVDELADLILSVGEEAQKPLGRLLQRGRQAGISIIAATQKPSAGILGSNLIPNFPIRLVGKVANKTESKTATGIPGAGAENLNGRGDFLLVVSGETRRFQALWLDSSGFAKLGAGGK